MCLKYTKEQKRKMMKSVKLTSGSSLGVDKKSEKQQLFSVFEVDYDFYFKNNHGLFVMQANMQYKLFKQLKKTIKFTDILQNIP